jgi:hypothetical protein
MSSRFGTIETRVQQVHGPVGWRLFAAVELDFSNLPETSCKSAAAGPWAILSLPPDIVFDVVLLPVDLIAGLCGCSKESPYDARLSPQPEAEVARTTGKASNSLGQPHIASLHVLPPLSILPAHMAAKKNTEGLAFIVEALKKNKSALYADIKEAASKKGLTIWPVMYGRAQALLGHVKVAKRGEGRFARANAAKAGRVIPAAPPESAVRRGPGRPRKDPLPVGNGVGLDSILDAVRNTQADLGRYREALERIGSMLDEVLA